MGTQSTFSHTSIPPIVITGGGTGGHLYPALSVAQAIRRLSPDTPILYIGREAERDRTEVERRGFAFTGFPMEGLRRKLDTRNLRALWRFMTATLRCLLMLRRHPRGVVFGVGGYVSAPAMIAAKILGWSVSLHEQNTVPGLVNRSLGRLCTTVYLTYAKTLEYWAIPKAEVVGFPLRDELVLARNQAETQTDTWKPHILVIGGSQGARRLTQVALEAFSRLSERNMTFEATVQTGPLNFEWAQSLPAPEGVSRVPYIDNMAEAYARCSIVISRAGSGSLSEIALWGLPAILVPFPYASEDHQRVNAEVFTELNAAIQMTEKELSSEQLSDELHTLLTDETRRRDMSRNAASLARVDASERIARELIQLASG